MSKLKELFKTNQKVGNRTNDQKIKEEMDRLLLRLKTLEPGTDDYLATLGRIDDLNRLLPKREKKSIDINTILSIGATIIIAGLAFYEEQIKDHIIRSKLWSWVRPKI